MKQRITIPDKVTQSIFSLPCVHSIKKSTVWGIEYYIIDEGFAHPGDSLIADKNGKWHLERRKP